MLHDAQTYEAAWKFLIENRDTLFNICKRACIGSNIDAEDVYADVCIKRMPRLIELYDPTLGSLIGYARHSLKLYANKYVAKKSKEPLISYDLTHDEDNPSYNVFEQSVEDENMLRLTVLKILEGLSEEHQQILVLKFYHSCTFEELAYLLDCSLGTAHKRYTEALREAAIVAGAKV